MSSEPVARITTVTTAVSALLASVVKAVVLLDIVDWTADQLAGITLVVDNALAVISLLAIILLVRPQVTPVASPELPIGTRVNERVDDQPTGVVREV